MVRKFRLLSLLSLLVLATVVAGGCQAVHAEPAPVARTAADIADELMGIREPVVVDGVGPSTASDPAQAQAEDEFLAAAIAKEQTFYAGDSDRYMSYYADNALSVQPGIPEIVGKAALAEGTQAYLADNQIVGRITIKRIWVYGDHATRQAEWEEVVTPKAGGPAEHHIGRCTLNWEKIDGEWKVVTEFVNYLDPPTPVQ